MNSSISAFKPAVRRGRRFSVGPIEVSIDNTWLKGALGTGTPDLSPDRLNALWHEVPNLVFGDRGGESGSTSEDSRASGVVVRSIFTNEPRAREGLALVRLVNPSDQWIELRGFLTIGNEVWSPGWLHWSVAYREFSELEGGEWTAEQDGVSEGVLSLSLPPGTIREFSMQLLDNSPEHTYPQIFEPRLNLVAREKGSTTGAEESLSMIIEIEHPSSAFLELLPSIFREAMDGMRMASDFGDPPFFERYLRGFEDVWGPFQALVGRLDSLFGPYSTPPDYLLWLAGWVYAPLDDNWPTMKRRKLIAEAVELFRWRGTRKGLSRYIELFLGTTPDILDMPIDGMRLGDDTLMGADAKLGDIPPHVFTVTVSKSDITPEQVATLRQIIEFEKPAHTAYTLQVIR